MEFICLVLTVLFTIDRNYTKLFFFKFCTFVISTAGLQEREERGCDNKKFEGKKTWDFTRSLKAAVSFLLWSESIEAPLVNRRTLMKLMRPVERTSTEVTSSGTLCRRIFDA